MNSSLTQKFMDLYVIPGSHFNECRVGVTEKHYPRIARPLTIDKIERHLDGKISICAISSFMGLAKWVIVDIDEGGLETAAKAYNALKANGLPVVASYSGSKGYHLGLFYAQPKALFEVQQLAGKIKDILDGTGITYCKISPSPDGKGGDAIKLPLGLHPVTIRHCYFMDENLNPVSDSASFIEKIQYVDNAPSGVEMVNKETGEIIVVPSPETISPRPCIDTLWQSGLQKASTRHSATCVVANAIAKNPAIRVDDKEVVLLNWVMKTYASGKMNGLIHQGTCEIEAIQDARQMLRDYMFQNYGESCENEVFKAAMRSACRDEFQCKLVQNHNHININLLLRLGIFKSSAATLPGLGKTTMAVYFAALLAAEDHRLFTWHNLPAFTLSTQMTVEMADCTKGSVVSSRRRLVKIGLLVPVPVEAIPTEILPLIPSYLHQLVFALADINDKKTVEAILKSLREGNGQ